jgi:CMP/dCMP kinase
MIIAVDGPAASGKGTIARALAAHYRLPHLDTGLLYRAVAWTLLVAGADPADSLAAAQACSFPDQLLADPQLRLEAAGNIASLISANPAVRAALLARQRAFAAQPGGAVLDGRDIATVIAPDADAKLFVTASAAIRAHRRHAQAPATSYAQILADIEARDARDSNRLNAPLRKADDAALLDTGKLTIAESIRQAIALVDSQIKR